MHDENIYKRDDYLRIQKILSDLEAEVQKRSTNPDRVSSHNAAECLFDLDPIERCIGSFSYLSLRYNKDKHKPRYLVKERANLSLNEFLRAIRRWRFLLNKYGASPRGSINRLCYCCGQYQGAPEPMYHASIEHEGVELGFVRFIAWQWFNFSPYIYDHDEMGWLTYHKDHLIKEDIFSVCSRCAAVLTSEGWILGERQVCMGH